VVDIGKVSKNVVNGFKKRMITFLQEFAGVKCYIRAMAYSHLPSSLSDNLLLSRSLGKRE